MKSRVQLYLGEAHRGRWWWQPWRLFPSALGGSAGNLCTCAWENMPFCCTTATEHSDYLTSESVTFTLGFFVVFFLQNLYLGKDEWEALRDQWDWTHKTSSALFSLPTALYLHPNPSDLRFDSCIWFRPPWDLQLRVQSRQGQGVPSLGSRISWFSGGCPISTNTHKEVHDQQFWTERKKKKTKTKRPLMKRENPLSAGPDDRTVGALPC